MGCCLHELCIPGATFPLAMVLMAVLLMLCAATSLRAAAAAIEISEQVYRNRLLAGSTHNTVRNYLLRLGVYELTRAKAVFGDWVRFPVATNRPRSSSQRHSRVSASGM